MGGDLHALWAEDAAVRGEEVSALHARPPGARADEQGEVAAVEPDGRVIRHLDVLQQPEGAVLQLEGRALGCAQPLRDLQQSQPHLLLGAEEVAGRDAEQQRKYWFANGYQNGLDVCEQPLTLAGDRLWSEIVRFDRYSSQFSGLILGYHTFCANDLGQ